MTQGREWGKGVCGGGNYPCWNWNLKLVVPQAVNNRRGYKLRANVPRQGIYFSNGNWAVFIAAKNKRALSGIYVGVTWLWLYVTQYYNDEHKPTIEPTPVNKPRLWNRNAHSNNVNWVVFASKHSSLQRPYQCGISEPQCPSSRTPLAIAVRLFCTPLLPHLHFTGRW